MKSALCFGWLLLFRPAYAAERPRIAGQWLIVFQENIPRASLKSDPRNTLHASLGASLIKRFDAIDTDLVAFPAGVSEDALAQSYRQSPLVSVVEPNGIVEQLSPNDTLYSSGFEPWYDQIRATQAFDAWSGGQIVLKDTITVAVIDTGSNAVPDLAGQLLSGPNYIGYEANTDLEGHGTFVAGIIAASVSNSAGIAGVFFNSAKVKILPVKVLDGSGRGTDATVASGLIYAADHGARVANLSLGEDYKSETVRMAVDYARKVGVFVVAAAGNNSAAVFYPAAFPNVFAVSAVDSADLLTPYSNYGRVDLAAPGGMAPGGWSPCVGSPVGDTHTAAIWSLCKSGSQVHYGAGTSFSAPMVAAAAALLLSQDSSRTHQDLYRILTQSADSSAYGSGYHPQTGWGRLNIYQALTYAGGPIMGITGAKLKVYNWPNPFNPEKEGSTNLTFYLERSAAATLRVRDLAGDLLFEKNLEASATFAGMNIISWDGRNGIGRMASNGTYLFTVEADSKKGFNRIMVLR